MGIVARQSIFSTILLYAGAVLGYVNLLYFYPRFLTMEEIGVTRTVQDMAALFVPLAQWGLTHGLIRFFPRFGLKDKGRPGFLTLILILGMAGYLLFLVIFYLLKEPVALYFSENASEIIAWFPLVLGITFLLLLYNLLTAYSQSLLHIIAPNFIKDILFRLGTALILVLYFMGWLDFHGLMVSFLAIYGTMTLSMALFLYWKGELKFSFDMGFLNPSLLRQLGIFALFSLMGTSGMLVIGKIDSLMVTAMLGPEYNGIYTTLFYIAVVIELPKRAMNQISLPLVSRSFEENDLTAIRKLYRQTSVNQLLVGAILLIGLWINLDNIFNIMPQGGDFAVGKWVVVIIGLGRMFDMAAGINSEIIVMSKFYRFNMVLLLLLAAFMVWFNLLFIPLYGIEGAALGSALALVLFNVAKFIFIRIRMGIQPFSKGSFVILAISAVTLMICLYLPAFESTPMDILVRSTLAILIYGTGILLFKPSAEIAGLIDKYLRKKS